MSLELDPVRTALVVIDMTKRIFSIESMPHPIHEVLAKTTSLADALWLQPDIRDRCDERLFRRRTYPYLFLYLPQNRPYPLD